VAADTAGSARGQRAGERVRSGEQRPYPVFPDGGGGGSDPRAGGAGGRRLGSMSRRGGWAASGALGQAVAAARGGGSGGGTDGLAPFFDFSIGLTETSMQLPLKMPHLQKCLHRGGCPCPPLKMFSYHL